jgi:hypothetical protein
MYPNHFSDLGWPSQNCRFPQREHAGAVSNGQLLLSNKGTKQVCTGQEITVSQKEKRITGATTDGRGRLPAPGGREGCRKRRGGIESGEIARVLRLGRLEGGRAQYGSSSWDEGRGVWILQSRLGKKRGKQRRPPAVVGSGLKEA